MQPTLGKRAVIPMRLLDRSAVRQAQTSLRFKEKQAQIMDLVLASADDDADEEAESHVGRTVIVNEYRERRGVVSLPRAWAMSKFPHLPWHDNTSDIAAGVRYNGGPQPRDLAQKTFFEGLHREASARGPQDILANADTGAGKSVAGIWLGQRLAARTLILVDQNKLANGWLGNMRKFYGAEWVSKYVGRVQQDRCEYEGKAFTIGLLQSIVSRDYGPDFYKAFGLTIFDEIQIYGSEGYAKALSMFNSRVRVGFTAENRKGSFGRIIKAHLGDTRVVSKQEVMKPTAYLIKNSINATFYCMTDGAILNGLARLPDRNEKLAKLIKRRGYDRGRHVLVLSERTEQLVRLRRMCIELGVPAEDMGLHMAKYVSDRFELVYSYGTNQLPLAVFDTRAEAMAIKKRLAKGELCIEVPKALQAKMRKDIKSVMFDVRKEIYEPSQEELDNITNSCQIVFATKQIFSKGVDVPRLDMGVEALPLGNLKQPLGRVLRVLDGKDTPEWYSISDKIELDGPFGNSGDRSANLINSYLKRKTATRLAALKRSKATLVRA